MRNQRLLRLTDLYEQLVSTRVDVPVNLPVVVARALRPVVGEFKRRAGRPAASPTRVQMTVRTL